MKNFNYEKAINKLATLNKTEFTNAELAKMIGFEPTTENEKRLVSMISAQVRSAASRAIRDPERDFEERGGFAAKYGPGRNNGKHTLLTGEDYIVNQVAANMKRLQDAMIEIQYDNMKLEQDMATGSTKKMASLLEFAKDSSDSMNKALIGQMDASIMALQRKHNDFKALSMLRERLDQFYALAYEPVED